MNANAIAIGTPSGERYIRAASKFAFGEVNCFARIPPVLAGERRKILGGTGWWNNGRPRTRPAAVSYAPHAAHPALHPHHHHDQHDRDRAGGAGVGGVVVE